MQRRKQEQYAAFCRDVASSVGALAQAEESEAASTRRGDGQPARDRLPIFHFNNSQYFNVGEMSG